MGNHQSFFYKASKASGPSLRVLVVLLGHASFKTRESYPSRSLICDALGYSPATVSRSIGELVDMGLIERVAGEGFKFIILDRVKKKRVESNGISERFKRSHPELAAILLEVILGVEKEDQESVVISQRTSARKGLELLLNQRPLAEDWILSSRADFISDLIEGSTNWGSPKTGKGLGYGRRIAWVLNNRTIKVVPAKTVEEKADEAVRALDAGVNPFL